MAENGTRWIGRYRILRPIGTGGFATVYRAVDERLGSEVALKVLAENHSLTPDIRERFVSEAQHLRRVDSYWVASIFDLGETDTGQPFMVLELADRGDLDTRVNDLWDNRRPLGREDLLVLADTLAHSLSAIHAADLVHRDVTPGNLLVRHNGIRPEPWSGQTLLDLGERLLLSDLGYAKDLRLASGITSGGGTAGFAAPEQTGEMTQVDQRADIYGATAVLTWAALGSRFESELQELATVGMAEDPDARFSDMSIWNSAVHQALGSSSPSSPLGRPSEEAQPQWAKQALAVAVAISALLILAGLWSELRPNKVVAVNESWYQVLREAEQESLNAPGATVGDAASSDGTPSDGSTTSEPQDDSAEVPTTGTTTG